MDDLVRRFRKLFLWSLGMRKNDPRQTSDWYTDTECLVARSRLHRRRSCLAATTVFFPIILIICSIYLVWWGIDCNLLGKPLSASAIVENISNLLFYWPLLVLSPTICIIVFVKSAFHRRAQTGMSGQAVTWMDAFTDHEVVSCNAIGGPRISQWCTLIGYYTLLVVSGTLEAYDRKNLPTECHTWSATLVIFCNIAELSFFCNFCYFLYLKRKSLERYSRRSVTFIQLNIQHQERCCSMAHDFFRRYYALRKFLFTWLNVVLFCTAFGFAFFLTWALEYSQIDSIPTHSPCKTSLDFDDGLFCSKACKRAYVEGDYNVFVFLAKVLAQKMMMALLALHVVKGLDLKYQWNHFKMNVYMATSSEKDKRSWKQLSDLLERIHPDTYNDVLVSITIPLLGLIIGFISGRKAV